MRRFWVGVAVIFHLLAQGDAVDCFTCMVDFRAQLFDQNDTCLYPVENKERTRCNEVSKYCKATILRINGVFVQLQRTCESSCQETCTEKGYGIAYKECTFCCTENARCGNQGYKSSALALVSKDTLYITTFYILLYVLKICI